MNSNMKIIAILILSISDLFLILLKFSVQNPIATSEFVCEINEVMFVERANTKMANFYIFHM